MDYKSFYEILLLGEISENRFTSFEIEEIKHLDGETKLCGYLDDAALFSLLRVVRDLHLKLLKLELKDEKEVKYK